MKTYRIREGERLNLHGEILGGGELIELPEDLAQMHAARIDLVEKEVGSVTDEQ
jgi:hypothetical protein